MEPRLTPEDKKRIGNAVREHLRNNAVLQARDKSGTRKYICSPKELAYEASLTPATIFKLHSGDFSLKSMRLVQGILGVDFLKSEEVISPERQNSSFAQGVDSGGYSLEQIEPYIGTYLTVRRGATVPENLLTTLVQIYWSPEHGSARFRETNKFVSSHGKELDFSQSGTLHHSSHIGLIHLLTSFKGALRLVTLTRLQVMEPVMYGAILTQVHHSIGFIPTRTTVHYRKIGEDEIDPETLPIGVVRPIDDAFDRLSSDLEAAHEAILSR